MKNLLKRSLSLLPIFVLVLFLVHRPAVCAGDTVPVSPEDEVRTEEDQLLAKGGTCGENLTWSLNASGVLTVSGTGPMYAYSADTEVPWYDDLSQITTVRITKGVTSVGNRAFSNCKALTAVTIADSVTSVGDYAFNQCTALTGLILPDSVTSIGWDSFSHCTSLTSLTLGEGLVTIGSYAFNYCTALKHVVIPDKVTTIGSYAFNDCLALASVSLGKGVKTIGGYAFEDCEKLTAINIPNGVTTIEYGAFTDCISLEEIIIPDSVTSIGISAFYYCTSLRTVTLSKNITAISSSLFSNCRSLTDFTIPENVTTIGYSAFDSCVSLSDITIPAGVTSIGYGAFNGCTGLTEIIIPSSVTRIAYGAFSGCSNLSSVQFSGDAPAFADNVFQAVTAEARYPMGNPTWTDAVKLDYGGKLTWVSYSTAKPKTPAAPYKITNVVSGIHVYWNAMDGISKYGLWRSSTGENGTYQLIANLAVLHYTDTSMESGKTYYYRVTAVDSKSGTHSDMSDAVGLTYVATPNIFLRVNRASGIGLGWNAIQGATGYAIYRKSYSGTDTWKRIATVSGGSTVSWDDTSVKANNGTVYRYTIRALTGSDMKTLSGCRSTGRTMVRLVSRSLTSATAASKNSIKCVWTTTAQATGYEVRFMVGSTVYKTVTVGNYKTGVKTFNGLPAGQSYKVQVRAYKKVDGVGSFYSAWSTAKYVTLE